MKINKNVKTAQKHLANGHSIEAVVSWWNRLVANAEIKDGKATFYLHEAKRDGQGGWMFTGKQFIALEIAL